MTLDETHKLENDLWEELKKKEPTHPAVKRFYSSTWAAIDSLYEALYGHKFFGDESEEQND